jgi:hypothetical protein
MLRYYSGSTVPQEVFSFLLRHVVTAFIDEEALTERETPFRE